MIQTAISVRARVLALGEGGQAFSIMYVAYQTRERCAQSKPALSPGVDLTRRRAAPSTRSMLGDQRSGNHVVRELDSTGGRERFCRRTQHWRGDREHRRLWPRRIDQLLRPMMHEQDLVDLFVRQKIEREGLKSSAGYTMTLKDRLRVGDRPQCELVDYWLSECIC